MVHGYVPLQVQELYESSLVRLANLIAPTMIQELGMRVVTWPAQDPLRLVSLCSQITRADTCEERPTPMFSPLCQLLTQTA